MENFFGLSENDLRTIRKLDTPKKVQDFINKLEMNFDPIGESCRSPAMVLKTGKAYCIEGALLAAAILRYHGYEPLILDLESTSADLDHVVALFREGSCWGAISKTNYAVLRYRDPVYRSIRELSLSYFNEYFMDNGFKTLRRYSLPVNLKMFDKQNWISSEEDVWFIAEFLTTVKHYDILTKKQRLGLRRADPIEIEAGKLRQFKEPKNRKKK